MNPVTIMQKHTREMAYSKSTAVNFAVPVVFRLIDNLYALYVQSKYILTLHTHTTVRHCCREDWKCCSDKYEYST